MTPEQIAALIAAEIEKATKALAAELTAAHKVEMDAVRADVAKVTAKPPEPAPKPTGKPNEVSPEMAEMREGLARATKIAEDEKALRLASEKAARSKETDAAISRALQEHGINPATIPAVALLVKNTMLAEKEDGSVFFRGKHPISGLDAELPIGDGIKAWAATPDAANYKAPRGVQGDGSRQGTPQTGNTGGINSLAALRSAIGVPTAS